MRQIIAAFALISASLSAPALAQEPSWHSERYVWPEYYVVDGVPEGDTLSIRAAPDATSEELGAFAEGAGPIEVLRISVTGSTAWAEIIHFESQAFIAARFLAPYNPGFGGGGVLPNGLVCGGTEPFWDITFPKPNQAHFDSLASGETIEFQILNTITAQNRGWSTLLELDSSTIGATLFVEPGWCSDGMSDRDYPWRATFYSGQNGGMLMQGCCHLPAPIH